MFHYETQLHLTVTSSEHAKNLPTVFYIFIISTLI